MSTIEDIKCKQKYHCPARSLIRVSTETHCADFTKTVKNSFFCSSDSLQEKSKGNAIEMKHCPRSIHCVTSISESAFRSPLGTPLLGWPAAVAFSPSVAGVFLVFCHPVLSSQEILVVLLHPHRLNHQNSYRSLFSSLFFCIRFYIHCEKRCYKFKGNMHYTCTSIKEIFF